MSEAERRETSNEPYLAKIEEVFGPQVLARVLEQLKSNDHQNSVCSGLVKYLLGFQDTNTSVSIDEFLNQYGSIESGSLKALGNVNADYRGDRANSNIVVYLHPFSGFAWHVALYLGEINGKHYEFGQWENGKPRFVPIDPNQELMFYRIEPNF